MASAGPILWDVVEEHLDEAGFLWQLWEEALRSPAYTLAAIAGGPEGRLLAHLDALAVAGPPADGLLLEALGGEPGPAFASAFVLGAKGRAHLAEILAALAGDDPERRTAIRRALAVATGPDLARLLAAELPRLPPPAATDVLDVLAYVRVDPGVRLEPLVASGAPGDRARALRSASFLATRLDPRAVELALADPEPEVREAAFEVAAVTGVRGAQSACRAEIDGRGAAFATAAVIAALSGDEGVVAALVGALADEPFREAAAFALGFTGRAGAADALVEAMAAGGRLARVAADAFSAVTGLVLEDRFVVQPVGWKPDAPEAEGEEPYGPEIHLPDPAPAAIARWWKEARPRMDAGRRWLVGTPRTREAIVRELAAGPARRRRALALELALSTRGAVPFPWDALSTRQRDELARASAAPGRLEPAAKGA